jgi:hypothetical protein
MNKEKTVPVAGDDDPHHLDRGQRSGGTWHALQQGDLLAWWARNQLNRWENYIIIV